MAEQVFIELKPLTEVYDSLINRLKRQKGGPEIALKMLPSLSQAIYGLARARMYVIGGRTSQGKTSLALQMAMDVAKQGKRVFFLSLEMDEEELMLRMLSNISEIDANDLRQDIESHEGVMQKIRDFFAEDGKFPLLVTYGIGKTPNDLTSIIEDLDKPDVVIVDYLQATRKIDLERMTSMNNYILQFRELCVTHNFCGIMLSQINREAMDDKDRRPYMWQLKGSGTIEEHADLIMLLHWDFYYDAKKPKNGFTINVAKNRQGATTSIPFEYFPEIYKFKEAGATVKLTREDEIRVKTLTDLFGGRVVE